MTDPAANLPPDHAGRMHRTRLSLEGLTVGDAFGEAFSMREERALECVAARRPPPPPWPYTDDTQMAVGVVETLEAHGHINQDALAKAFARRAPGAYFAGDPPRIAAEARASAEVTHTHPEGQNGAVAIALAAGMAAVTPLPSPAALPAGATRQGLIRARALPPGTGVTDAARLLGNGSRISAQDTVPYVLWCTAQHLRDFQAALWLTVAGRGDRDTTCAMCGGIVALSAGFERIPAPWLAAREAFPPHVALQGRGVRG